MNSKIITREEAKNRSKWNAYKKHWNRALRLEVLNHYGGNPSSCTCCGEKHLEFLGIDHINKGGGEHRRQTGLGGSTNLYAWLKRNNFPIGFRILCHNCNLAIGFYGYCPHEKHNE